MISLRRWQGKFDGKQNKKSGWHSEQEFPNDKKHENQNTEERRKDLKLKTHRGASG
jgi:hypothetical protein